MRYFIVYAHPEPRSFNGFLRDRAVDHLKAAGHEVVESDLYAMRFKAVLDAPDFGFDDSSRLICHEAALNAYDGGTLSPDIAAEQTKLRDADVIILQFPLWWFGMPAILKGWVDRVFCSGFAIGLPRANGHGWRRYGEGPLEGKRAMLAVTTGAREQHLGPYGVHGPASDLLFPINHGILHYAGATVVKPFLLHGITKTSGEQAEAGAEQYAARLLGILEAPVIGFRKESGGDYQRGVLVDQSTGREGFALHVTDGDESAGEEGF